MKFWSWNHFVLLISLVLLNSQSIHALELQFGEDDFSEREGNGKLKVVVVADGEFTGSITVQVVPITVTQFLNQGLTPLPQTLELNDPNLGQAKAGADFNSEVQNCILEGGQGRTIDKDAFIDIVDDDISEHPEVFLLVLRVVNATDGLEIEMTRNVSVARIRQDNDASKTKVSFNGSVLDVNEGAGLLNDTLFIEIEGVAEPTLFVQLSMQGPLGESDSDDIHLLKSIISIPSGAKRVPVSLEIIDDVIVEELYETIRINIAPTDGQQSLFSTGQYGTVTIDIRDNDRAHFGFEVTSLQTGNSTRQLLEGEAAEVCVLLLDPEEFTTDALMIVELSSDSVPFLTVDADFWPMPNKHQYYFASDNLKYCFNITVNENEAINEPNTATFTMTPDATALLWPESVERIDMDDLHIVILDNDGIPKAPSNIELSLTDNRQDLLITWTSESSKLQPITQYRVSVRTENLDDSKSVDIRSRRQSDVELKEYITPEERLLLEDVEGGKTYTIQVCAENDLGHACALPEVVSIKVGKDGPKTLVLISDGLGDAESATVASTLPQGYVIIIILLPCILFLAVCILVISVIICSCSRYNSKNYYPSQQEKRMEKQIEAMEGRFHTRSLSAGSLNSTTSSASEFTRV